MSYLCRLPVIPHCSINQRHTEIYTGALFFGQFSERMLARKARFELLCKKVKIDMFIYNTQKFENIYFLFYYGHTTWSHLHSFNIIYRMAEVRKP